MQKIIFIFLVCGIIVIPVFGRALTVEEVIKLKDAGVSDETISLMIMQQSEKGVREVEDGEGNISIRYSTDGLGKDDCADREESEKVRRAWDMLKNLMIDGRR